jgi:hypothetical protein
MSDALDNHIASAETGVNFAILDNMGWGRTKTTFTDDNILQPDGSYISRMQQIVNYFKSPKYQKSVDGRPLYVLASVPDATLDALYGTSGTGGRAGLKIAIDNLRALSIAQGAGNPFIMTNEPLAINNVSYVRDLGLDGVSSYYSGRGNTVGGGPSTLYGFDRGTWEDNRSYFGGNQIAIVTTGWDKRPRYECKAITAPSLITISSISRTGAEVTVVATASHNLRDGQQITVNVGPRAPNATVTVISPTSFSYRYTLLGGESDPAVSSSPFLENCIPWENYGADRLDVNTAAWYARPFWRQTQAQFVAAIQFVKRVRTPTSPNAIIVYAWNEHDEGGNTLAPSQEDIGAWKSDGTAGDGVPLKNTTLSALRSAVISECGPSALPLRVTGQGQP